ncbi:AraC family transcriptional regulator [Pseudooceanicola sp. 200-1SW]|uniref:AraC family transcriptional regulator n=1 Tax=Pseudooceanicola sp. 200-1SW TaxID=3425949 RepID=UPI003D7F2300
MLETALVEDGTGAPLLTGERTFSADWRDVDSFCCETYMRMQIRPVDPRSRPDAILRRVQIGQITFSRFRFGVPTRTEEFDPASGNIIVVNTLRGRVRHPLGGDSQVETRPGESYVVDCSRTDYWNEADGQDLQFNLTIPHRLMEAAAERWYGFVPDDRLWTRRLVFGGAQSAWLALLDYATRSLDARHDAVSSPRIAAQIEETLTIELLQSWARGAGLDLETGARGAAPRYVREAERLMQEQAAQAPTITEIAAQLGISTRSLSSGFREFRGITPHSYLTALRLDALRAALEGAAPGQSVTAIAGAQGYINLGAMTRAYRARFGETPGQTLHRTPRG